MMHLVEIKYDKAGLYPKIYINKEEINEFMALRSIVNNDIFVWADKFFSSLDAEIGETYKVVVTGHPFHKVVLDACASKSKYCEEIELVEHQRAMPLVEKYKFAVQKSAVYFPNKSTPAPCLAINCDSVGYFQKLGIKNVAYANQTTSYHLLKAEEAWDCSPCKHRIVLADDNLIRKQRTKYNLFVTRENLACALDYFNCYHLMLPFVNQFFDAIKDRQLTNEAQLEVEAYLLEEYRVYVPKVPKTMDADKQYSISYRFYPKCFKKPQMLLQSSDPSIAKCVNGVVVPATAGTFELSLVDTAGTLYFSKEIEVVKHNYITNIALQIPSFVMHPSDILRFPCVFAPSNAEDVKRVRYTVSDPTVAAITNEKHLYALKPGRVKVTVTSELVQKSFYVSVLPPLTDIVLSSESITMPYNSDAFVDCSLVPFNADPVPTITWTSSNPKIAQVTSTSPYGCKITAKKFGECFVTCSVDGTDIVKNISVTVKNAACYVATAVYGSYDCPEVWVLRRYRDQRLAQNCFGRAFIKVYYFLSPKIIRLFGKQKWFNRFWKKRLDKMVDGLKDKGFDETPYIDE